MKDETRKNLERVGALIDQKLTAMEAELGPRPDWHIASLAERDGYWSRERAFLQKIIQELTAEESAVISLTGAHQHTMTLAGIRTSCTSGWKGLLHNWQAAARRRMEKENAA